MRHYLVLLVPVQKGFRPGHIIGELVCVDEGFHLSHPAGKVAEVSEEALKPVGIVETRVPLRRQGADLLPVRDQLLALHLNLSRAQRV